MLGVDWVAEANHVCCRIPLPVLKEAGMREGYRYIVLGVPFLTSGNPLIGSYLE